MSYSDKKMRSDFLKAISAQSKTKTKAYDTTATVTRVDEDGTAWVHIPGGVDETPCEMTISCSEGDTVKVRVSGGRCYTIGNTTAPPTDDTKVDEVAEEIEKKVETVKEALEIEAESLTLRVTGAEDEAESAMQKATEIEVTVDGIDARVTSAEEDAGTALEKATEIGVTVDGIDARVTSAETNAESALTKATEISTTVDGISTTVTEIEGDYQKASTMEQTVKGFTWTVTGDDLAAVEDTAESAETDASNALSNASSALSQANSAYSYANTAYNAASDARKVATNYLSFSSSGLVVGDMTSSSLGKNVLIDSEGVDIRNGSTVLASFGANKVELGKNSSGATIDLLNGKGQIRMPDSSHLVLESSNSLVAFTQYNSSSSHIDVIAANDDLYTGTPTRQAGLEADCNDSDKASYAYLTAEGQNGVKAYVMVQVDPTNATAIYLQGSSLYFNNNRISQTKAITITGTIGAETFGTISGTFTMPSPYRIVTGIRDIGNNHPSACKLTRFYINGDGASGNTTTIKLTFYNTTSSTQSMSCPVQVCISI